MQKTEKSVEQERQKAVTASSNSINMIHTLPYDQFGSETNELTADKKDTLMTQIQGKLN